MFSNLLNLYPRLSKLNDGIFQAECTRMFLSSGLLRPISFLLPSLVSVQTNNMQQLAVKAFIEAIAVVGEWQF